MYRYDIYYVSPLLRTLQKKFSAFKKLHVFGPCLPQKTNCRSMRNVQTRYISDLYLPILLTPCEQDDEETCPVSSLCTVPAVALWLRRCGMAMSCLRKPFAKATASPPFEPALPPGRYDYPNVTHWCYFAAFLLRQKSCSSAFWF